MEYAIVNLECLNHLRRVSSKMQISSPLLALCLALVPLVAPFSRSVPLALEFTAVSIVSSSVLFSRRAKPEPSPYPHLHLSEYPKDDYDHVLGHGNPGFVPSRLQEISARCIEDVIRNKKPIDAVSSPFCP